MKINNIIMIFSLNDNSGTKLEEYIFKQCRNYMLQSTKKRLNMNDNLYISFLM